MRAMIAPGQKAKSTQKSNNRDKNQKSKSKVVVRRKAPTPAPTPPTSRKSQEPSTASTWSKASSPSASNEKEKKVGGARSKSRSRFSRKLEKTETTEVDDKGRKIYSTQKKSQPKKMTVSHHTVDQDEMRKFLKKAKDKKTTPRAAPRHLSQRENLLMDVVKKTPSTRQYKYRSKNALPLADEDASFFDKPEPKTTTSEDTTEDAYEHAPRLADVLKMKRENVFEADGVTPYWATVLEPTEEEMKDTEEAISVGSDHVEMMTEGKINLKTAKSKNVVLDEFQPMSQLMKRDDVHFHTHLVFSNTIRSLINVSVKNVGGASADQKEQNEEQMTQREETVTFVDQKPIEHTYCRSDPIGTARAPVPAAAVSVAFDLPVGKGAGGSADSDSVDGK